jgi:uncharacterized protein (TIGR01244 family)
MNARPATLRAVHRAVHCATLWAAAALLAAGCAGVPTAKEDATSSGLEYVRVGDLAIAGQPTEAQLDEIAALGYRTVVTLRAPDEIPWDEKAAVTRRGMRFMQVPVKAETVEVGTLARIQVLIDPEQSGNPGPVFFHCNSGNRCALVWAMLEAGERPDAEIIDIARRAGLKAGEVPRLEAYLKQHAEGLGRLK